MLWTAALATLAGCRAAPAPPRVPLAEPLEAMVRAEGPRRARAEWVHEFWVAEGAGLRLDNPWGAVTIRGAPEPEPHAGAPVAVTPAIQVRPAPTEPTPNVRVVAVGWGFGRDQRAAERMSNAATLAPQRRDQEGWLVLEAAAARDRTWRALEVVQGRPVADGELMPRLDLELWVGPRVSVEVRRALEITVEDFGTRSRLRELGGGFLRAEGDLDLRASFGIAVRRVRAGTIAVRTDLGRVTLDDAAGVFTCTGAQELVLTNCSGRKTARAIGGRLTIRGGGGAVDLEAEGDVEVRTTLAPVALAATVGEASGSRLQAASVRGEGEPPGEPRNEEDGSHPPLRSGRGFAASPSRSEALSPQPSLTDGGDFPPARGTPPIGVVRDHRDTGSRLHSRAGSVTLAIPARSALYLEAQSDEAGVLVEVPGASVIDGVQPAPDGSVSHRAVEMGAGPERAYCHARARGTVVIEAQDDPPVAAR